MNISIFFKFSLGNVLSQSFIKTLNFSENFGTHLHTH